MEDDASDDREPGDGTEDRRERPRSWDLSTGWADSDSDGDEWGRDEDVDGETGTAADRIPLDLSGERERDADEEDGDPDAEDDPYAPEPSSTPIEAGDPDLENAAFVVLGAIAMIIVLLRVVSLPF